MSSEDAQKAIRDLNDTDLGGRLLKIREDRVENDDRPRRSREKSSSSSNNSAASILGGLGGLGGLASMMGFGQFGILQQMSTRGDSSSSSVFVSNLDYRVTWAKLKDTFKAAGRVVRADIAEDADGKSRGHGTVQFETPLEAISAVGIMNGKPLLDRSMNVRLDRESPYYSMFSGNTNSLQAAPSLAGMAGINPLAMLQLQSMASLGMGSMGSMAGLGQLGGLAGFGGMNYGTAATTTGAQTSGITTADTSSLSGVSSSMANTNPYAAMFGAQSLGGQSYGGQTYMMPVTQPQVKVDTTKQVFVRNVSVTSRFVDCA